MKLKQAKTPSQKLTMVIQQVNFLLKRTDTARIVFESGTTEELISRFLHRVRVVQRGRDKILSYERSADDHNHIVLQMKVS